MYVDGQPVMTFDPTPAQGDLTTTQPLLFGLHPAYPRIDCNYRGGIDEVSIYRRALTAAEVQTIYAAGAAGKCNIPAGPAILTQPSSQVVALGTNVVFSVTASGTPPLSYQWFKLGLPITNAKDSSLLISNVRSNDAGTYSVLITNYQGGMLSSNASLTVVVPPRILLQPNHQLAQPGCSAIFTVAAKGTPPLSYQWWKDGAPLIGQTNASLSLNDVQTNDLGNYSITITNVYGTTTSTPAALSWDRPPIANSDTILRFQSGGVRVKASDLTANDTDPDGDVLSVIGVSLTSAAGGTVGLNGPWVYYQPPPGFTNTDSFTYTVSDGICYGWAVGIVTVLVRTDNTPAGKLLIESVGDGSYRLAVDGAPGAPYRLQSAETLSPPNWQDLASGTADTFGVFQYVHFPGTNAPAKYYRSVSP
jgi:hypothetical protein